MLNASWWQQKPNGFFQMLRSRRTPHTAIKLFTKVNYWCRKISGYVQGSYTSLNINIQNFSGLFPELNFSEWHTQVKHRRYDSYHDESEIINLEENITKMHVKRSRLENNFLFPHYQTKKFFFPDFSRLENDQTSFQTPQGEPCILFLLIDCPGGDVCWGQRSLPCKTFWICYIILLMTASDFAHATAFHCLSQKHALRFLTNFKNLAIMRGPSWNNCWTHRAGKTILPRGP